MSRCQQSSPGWLAQTTLFRWVTIKLIPQQFNLLKSLPGTQNWCVIGKVTLNKDFIKKKLADMKVLSCIITFWSFISGLTRGCHPWFKFDVNGQLCDLWFLTNFFVTQVAIEDWLKEPQTYCQVHKSIIMTKYQKHHIFVMPFKFCNMWMINKKDQADFWFVRREMKIKQAFSCLQQSFLYGRICPV